MKLSIVFAMTKIYYHLIQQSCWNNIIHVILFCFYPTPDIFLSLLLVCDDKTDVIWVKSCLYCATLHAAQLFTKTVSYISECVATGDNTCPLDRTNNLAWGLLEER